MNFPVKIRFYLVNLLFPDSSDTMEFMVNGVRLVYQKIENYEAIEKFLRLNYGVSNTCYIDDVTDEPEIVDKIQKLPQIQVPYHGILTVYKP